MGGGVTVGVGTGSGVKGLVDTGVTVGAFRVAVAEKFASCVARADSTVARTFGVGAAWEQADSSIMVPQHIPTTRSIIMALPACKARAETNTNLYPVQRTNSRLLQGWDKARGRP